MIGTASIFWLGMGNCRIAPGGRAQGRQQSLRATGRVVVLCAVALAATALGLALQVAFAATLSPGRLRATRACHGRSKQATLAMRSLPQAPVAWGPLGPAAPAQAIVLNLPWGAPYRFDDTIFELLLLEAVTIAVVTLLVALFVRAQIESFKREREAGKLTGMAAGVVDSLGARLAEVPPAQWFKLFLCIVIDVSGDASYLIPAADLLFAPLEAFALKALFGGNVLAVLGFVEEALPFSDILPTASIGWALQTLAPDNFVTRALGIQPWRAAAAKSDTEASGVRNDVDISSSSSGKSSETGNSSTVKSERGTGERK